MTPAIRGTTGIIPLDKFTFLPRYIHGTGVNIEEEIALWCFLYTAYLHSIRHLFQTDNCPSSFNSFVFGEDKAFAFLIDKKRKGNGILLFLSLLLRVELFSVITFNVRQFHAVLQIIAV